jgi:hypothetical protein
VDEDDRDTIIARLAKIDAALDTLQHSREAGAMQQAIELSREWARLKRKLDMIEVHGP